MVEKTLPRFIARIVVSIFGAMLALFALFLVMSAPIDVPVDPYQQRQWANVFYMALVCLGSLLFYWSAFTNFDRNKIEKFF